MIEMSNGVISRIKPSQKDVVISPAKKQRADDFMCVHTLRVFSPGAKKDVKKRWIDDHDLWIADVSNQERVLTPVVMSGLLVWMDAITGSTYDSHGRCMTSDVLEIRLDTLFQNQDRAAEILMSITCKGIE